MELAIKDIKNPVGVGDINVIINFKGLSRIMLCGLH